MTTIADLERIIAHLDTLYEQGDDCIHPDTDEIVTDGEYDALRRELFALNPKSTLFNTATASNVVSLVKKVKHNPPMTSISKASHEDPAVQQAQLFKWMKDCIDGFPFRLYDYRFDLSAKTIDNIDHPDYQYNGSIVSYPSGFFYQTYKLDGVACALYYEDGVLISAGLRPRDGVNGEDVTEQIKFVSGVPNRLKQPITCSIRGELICKLSDFEIVQKELSAAGEKLRANPRNHTAGGIRQFKDPSKVKDMRLSFIGYAIEGFDNPPYKTEEARAKFCNKELGVSFVQARSFNFYDLKKMEDNIKNLDYEVDGVVIGVSNLDDQEQLGRHGDAKTGNPKGKIAWKFVEERATPVVKDKTWKTGRTGSIKPVAIFDAVSLAGTQVGRATLHNLGFIFRNKIQIGTSIIVLKAGKIIPKVVGVAGGHAVYNSINDVDYPKTCPSCGCKTVIEYTAGSTGKEDMYELKCPSKACPAQNVNSMCHYLDKVGALGLGESKVAALVEGGAIRNFSDFYKLDINKIKSCDFTDREALLALGSIWMINQASKYDDDQLKKKIVDAQKNKLEIPMWRLFSAFGIESAGDSAGKALVEHFKNFDNLLKATEDQLSQVDGVGSKTAIIVESWLADNRTMINELLLFIEPQVPKIGPLTGKSFCLTGSFAEGKSYWTSKIEELGGRCASSVSKSLSYVVVGVDAGSKEQKATDLGIKKLSVNDLSQMLGN